MLPFVLRFFHSKTFSFLQLPLQKTTQKKQQNNNNKPTNKKQKQMFRHNPVPASMSSYMVPAYSFRVKKDREHDDVMLINIYNITCQMIDRGGHINCTQTGK